MHSGVRFPEDQKDKRFQGVNSSRVATRGGSSNFPLLSNKSGKSDSQPAPMVR